MASNGGFEPMATEYASVDESGDDAGDRRAQNASLLHFDPKTVGDEMVNTGVGGEDAKPKLAAALFNEFSGTFFLCLCIGFTGSPIAIGWMLAVLVYSGGHLSGAHYNPAVTLCAALCTKLKWSAVLLYWGAQVAGAVAAGALTKSFAPHSPYLVGRGTPTGVYPVKDPKATDGQAFLGEFLITTVLCFTVCSVAFAKKQAGNSFFGYAIGFTVLAGAAAVGPISGGAFNPAVGCLAFFHSETVWIYWLAPLMGAAAAAVLYWTVFTDEIQDETLARFPGLRAKLALVSPYVMELVGTFYLCLIVGMRGTAAYEVGAILTAMVFAGGCVSGGHYNPAVTLTLLLSRAGDMSVLKAARYVGCQLVGALLAAWSASALSYTDDAQNKNGAASYPRLCSASTCNGADPISPLGAMVLEAIATFALCWTVLNVAVAKETAGNSFFGFAIGFVVFAMASMFGTVTGGAFNPAVGTLGFFHGHGGELYIYWIGDLAGAAAASFAFHASRVAKTM